MICYRKTYIFQKPIIIISSTILYKIVLVNVGDIEIYDRGFLQSESASTTNGQKRTARMA